MKILNYSRVKLLTDKYINEGVSSGSVGYVIEVYDNGYELEFSDKNGVTIALFSVAPDEIELYPETEEVV
jgi:hypothetical protein